MSAYLGRRTLLLEHHFTIDTGPNAMKNPRNSLKNLFIRGLGGVHGRHLVAQQLRQAGDCFPYVISLGKAAEAMLQGVVDVQDDKLKDSFLVTKQAVSTDFSGTALLGDHPIPGPRSLEAGAALLDFIAQIPQKAPILLLLSGGASALVDVPLQGVTLAQLQSLNQQLMASGLPIDEINRQRQALSAIKGGKFNGFLQGHPVTQWAISDVPYDDMSLLGSGLLDVADPMVTNVVLANNAMALDAMEKAALDLGLDVFREGRLLEGNANTLGQLLVDKMHYGPPGIYLWGGESTVELPDNPGQGGRNQQLALAAAKAMAGRDEFYLLAAGTDGDDGNTSAAGALVDGQTLARAKGLDADVCLRNCDSHRFLTASGDVITTGYTGTNVVDVVIGLKSGPTLWD